jgi:hypothetical protein
MIALGAAMSQPHADIRSREQSAQSRLRRQRHPALESALVEGFRLGLRERGYVEGKT